jgi:adenine phosphoribosyltransferase
MGAETITHHRVTLAGITRELPLLEVKPGLRIAILNTLGDTELIQAAAGALGPRLVQSGCGVLLTAEAKSIPLIHALSVTTGLPYVVLRKEYKSYMGDALSAEKVSITTGSPQKLYLDAKDRALMDGARVAIADDVISTGSTLESMEKIARLAGADIVAKAAICTEGDPAQWRDVIALGHLPLFE